MKRTAPCCASSCERMVHYKTAFCEDHALGWRVMVELDIVAPTEEDARDTAAHILGGKSRRKLLAMLEVQRND